MVQIFHPAFNFHLRIQTKMLESTKYQGILIIIKNLYNIFKNYKNQKVSTGKNW